MARLLILQDPDGAARTAALARRFGHDPLMLPLQRFEALEPEPMDAPVAAIALTSARAIPYLARHHEGAAVPVFTVGQASAARVRAAGFADVRPGAGQARSLAEPLAALSRSLGRPVLFLAGRPRSPALEEALSALGVPLHVREVYRTHFARPDAAMLEAALGGGRADAALLLSVGQAEAFEALCGQTPEVFAGTRPLCLSARIAETLAPERRTRALIAERPELSTLLLRYG